ncbi:hypothetical protein Bca101_019508 [Brassica carinata]
MKLRESLMDEDDKLRNVWQKTAVSDNTKVLYSRGIVKDSKVKEKLIVKEAKLLSITQKAEELKGCENAHMNQIEFSMANGGLVKTITKLLSTVQIEISDKFICSVAD